MQGEEVHKCYTITKFKKELEKLMSLDMYQRQPKDGLRYSPSGY